MPVSSDVMLSTVDPQFATVTFVDRDDTPVGTFRVPLDATTTVRRLAKAAMQRLVLMRRREGIAVAVMEVYVEGGGIQPRAEVFAQDTVLQVVSVKEEVIYMRLKEPFSHPGMTSGTAPSAVTKETVTRDELSSGAAGGPETSATKPTSSAPVSAAADLTKSFPAPTEASSSVEVTSIEEEGEEGQDSRKGDHLLGWGPDAHKHFAENYVSTPGKRQRRVPKIPTAPDAKKAKSQAEAAPPQAAQVQRGVLGWGPEASKMFPDNYVSSPDRVARLARQSRTAEVRRHRDTSAAADPPALEAVPTAVSTSRQLEYPVNEGEGGRGTVAHTIVEEEVRAKEPGEPAAPLPKGWGKEASKFFDPSTYCDDPKKARILPNMDLSRSSRKRRPASP